MAKGTLYVTVKLKVNSGDSTPLEAIAENVTAEIIDDAVHIVAGGATISKVEIEEVGENPPW